MDDVDVHGTFTCEEAKKLGIICMLPIEVGVKPGGRDIYEKAPSCQGSLSYVLE